MRAEIVHGMSMEDYRAAEAVSASDLKNLKRSPAYAKLSGKTTTPAQAWGTAVHTAILEPDELDKRYRIDPIQPPDNEAKNWRATKVYKEALAAILADGEVEGVLTPDEFEALEQIRENVARDPIGSKLHAIAGGNEVSVFSELDDLGFVKCRPDRLLPAAKMVVDVKTARSHLPRPFARACSDYDYHLSAALYLDALNCHGIYDHYVFLVVASDAPYEVRSYTLDADSIEQGRHEYRQLLRQWRGYEAANDWGTGGGAIEELRLPEYRITYHNEVGEEAA